MIDMKRIYACAVAEIPPGASFRVEPAGRAPIAIFNVDGVFYATDDTCTHGNASLSFGYLEGAIIECPFHAATFDVRNGKALTYPATESLKTYEVVVEGEQIFVLVDNQPERRSV